MNAADLYQTLKSTGVNLWVHGDKLRFAPQDLVTTNLLSEIKTFKLELITLISTKSFTDKTASSSSCTVNDHYEKIAVSEVCPKLDAPIHYQKIAVEKIRLTQSEEAYPPTVDGKHSQIVEVYPHIEDGQLTPVKEVTPTWLMDRYAHLITCQQCEHLTLTGYCRVKPQVKPIPEAMHDCVSFDARKTPRISIVNAPYTQMELKDLLGRDEKPLFQHLVDCRECCLQDSHYCEDVVAIGSNYEDSLLCFDDADRKRESLLNAVVKARVTRRKVFVGYPNANVPPPC